MATRKRKPTIREHLEEAEKLLDGGDVPSATIALVKAWGVTPSDRIAALVDRLATRLPPPEPFTERTVSEREVEWHLTAEKYDTLDVPRLLSLDWPVHPRGAKQRFLAWKNFTPDPRVVRSLVELRKSGRYDSNAGTTFWRSVFQLLYKWRYPGVHAMFSDIREETMAWYRFEGLLAKPAIPEPPLDEDAIAIIEAFEERLGTSKKLTEDRTRQRRALLEAVYETPDDDAPRLVFADFLVEEGDPRGEFIQLDIRLANEGKLPTKLLKQRNLLLRAGGRKWCEDIDVRLDGIEMRRGFASKAFFTERFDPQPEAHRTLEWLTCMFGGVFAPSEMVDVNEATNPVLDVPLHPNLCSVHTLTNVPPRLFAALVTRGRGRAFRHVGLAFEDWSIWERRLPKQGCQVRIDELAIAEVGTLRQMLATEVIAGAEVRRLTLHQVSLGSIPAVAPLFKDLPASVREVQTNQLNAGWRLLFSRPSAPATWKVQAEWLEKRAPDRDRLEEVLAKVPKGILGDLEIVSGDKSDS